MKAIILALSGLLLLATPVAVQAQLFYTNADGSIYTYTTNADGSANIAGYAGPPWAVTIPSNINGLTVTSIGAAAFYICGSLTSVTIPGSVTSIGESAFYGCIWLGNITITAGVTSIGDNAFEYCYSLTSIAIPESVTNIGDYAFAYCDGLSSVYMVGNGPTVGTSVFFDSPLTSYHLSGAGDGYYYSINPDNTNTITIVFYTGPGGEVSIPTNINGVTVTGIGDSTNSVFGYTGLTNVLIPESVTSIGGECILWLHESGQCHDPRRRD
ncbi:MAG: leucine-rich repeat domain-containing protein [Limisphaerales bacterium]